MKPYQTKLEIILSGLAPILVAGTLIYLLMQLI